MVTGDKITGPKKIRFGGSRHYGQITDELRTNGAKMCEKQILKKSRKFYRYPIYWHQINHLDEWRLVIKEQVKKIRFGR